VGLCHPISEISGEIRQKLISHNSQLWLLVATMGWGYTTVSVDVK